MGLPVPLFVLELEDTGLKVASAYGSQTAHNTGETGRPASSEKTFSVHSDKSTEMRLKRAGRGAFPHLHTQLQ